jgi:uncharacterized protein YdiU (UPF0061 family)
MQDNHDRSRSAGWSFENTYAELPSTLFTEQKPTPVGEPQLVAFNKPLAGELGLDAGVLSGDEGVAVLAGNLIPEGALPLAQAYAGHQFGNFTMLGDGRAILLGEQLTPDGRRLDIQFKGAGATPYSRRGDGRAALGPMLREYIISEAMHGLGIPTTRSLAVVATGEPVYRETVLPGAVLTRVAASHLRVGTFQYAANWGGAEALYALADYALQRHYPGIPLDDGRYLALLRGVIARQAELIARWMLVGFVHGVMNTDNMTISGETIDYGPCAFLDSYDPKTVFSSIDANGRYAYGNQPYIGVWNLARLAESLLPLLHDDEEQAVKLAEDALREFTDLYHGHWMAGMRGKLGLFGSEDEDETLFKDLLGLLQQHRADYTNTFVALTFGRMDGEGLWADEALAAWKVRWQERQSRHREAEDDSLALMKSSNPAVIPRNHRVEEALEAAVEGDLSVMENLLRTLADPYAHTPEQAEYATVPEACGPYRTFCGT